MSSISVNKFNGPKNMKIVKNVNIANDIKETLDVIQYHLSDKVPL
jgi:hypothetical protein